MRAVLQRVSWAKVEVDGDVIGEIRQGLCALVGVAESDKKSDAEWLARKVVSARIFEDEADKMNKSVVDIGGRVLAISQFTLLGDCRRGNRPSFSRAMEPQVARELFEYFCDDCRKLGVPVETGRFRAQMEVSLNNSGPVTLLLDSERAF